TCGLVQLELEVTYSARRLLFRPSGVDLVFRRGEDPIFAAPIRVAEPDQPFTTFVSLVHPASFYKLFDSTSIPAPVWDNLAYFRSRTDKLSARPRAIEVRRMQCMDP